jgi:uncharacterized protein YfaP (DUF2135 family)
VAEKGGKEALSQLQGSGIKIWTISKPIGSMYGIYANIWGILMVNVTIYSIHGSYGKGKILLHQW